MGEEENKNTPYEYAIDGIAEVLLRLKYDGYIKKEDVDLDLFEPITNVHIKEVIESGMNQNTEEK